MITNGAQCAKSRPQAARMRARLHSRSERHSSLGVALTVIALIMNNCTYFFCEYTFIIITVTRDPAVSDFMIAPQKLIPCL